MDICEMAYWYRGHLLYPLSDEVKAASGGEVVSDGTLLRHLEIIRDALTFHAGRKPSPGRPSNRSATDQLIVHLTHYLRLCLRGTRLSLPLYKAMAELIFATLGNRWTPESLRARISKLFKESRYLFFRVNPENAEVLLDGIVQGKASDFTKQQCLEVEGGRHRLELRAPGYESYRSDIHASGKIFSPQRIDAALVWAKDRSEAAPRTQARR
jgi:hypothetical protein